MPKDGKMTGKTGSAQIIRQGHTASGNFGDDPNMKGKGTKPARDLKAK